MTDKPAPTPAPAEPAKPLVHHVIVKDGTTSSAQDREAAAIRASIARREAYVTQQLALAEAPAADRMGFVGRMNMQSDTSPRVILRFVNRDGTERFAAVCELTVEPAPGAADLGGQPVLTFYLPCPKCVERGVPQSHAQMKISSNHRKWWLNTEKAGVEKVFFGVGPGMPDGFAVVNVAGTVDVQDTIRCAGAGCGYACRIEGSRVRDV